MAENAGSPDPPNAAGGGSAGRAAPRTEVRHDRVPEAARAAARVGPAHDAGRRRGRPRARRRRGERRPGRSLGVHPTIGRRSTMTRLSKTLSPLLLAVLLAPAAWATDADDRVGLQRDLDL